MSKRFISPIAIDLGAKNTGVYFAHYPAGSTLGVFEEPGTKTGKVYQLDSNNYTYLMANRTAKRHQRRGFDRRQMAKRLFKLIWCKHFKLPWDKDVQQTISFLLNRRGFSFLTEEYDAEILSQFPQEAFFELPIESDELQNDNGDYDFDSALTEWTNEGIGKVKQKYDAIKTKIYIEKLRGACLQFQKSKKYVERIRDNNKLSKLDQDVFNKLKDQGVEGISLAKTGSYSYTTRDGEQKTLPYRYGEKVNLAEYVNHSGNTKEILASLPEETNRDYWNFNAAKFDIEKINESEKEEERFFNSESKPNIKTHLHHLTFALGKILNELESGGRHRSKYFEEVKAVLENENHRHGYLKRFCKQLQSGKYQELNVDRLTNLIGHISNLELKPLRKYFNDEKHKISKTNKEGDQWDEQRITRFFERWILREWRVSEKDKDKADNKKASYSKLKRLWNEHDKVVNFWLHTCPVYTIPPYQDNNNRRPPKCQSLILNVVFLNKKYPNWQQWLDELKKLKPVKDYLDNYEEELKGLKSSKEKEYFSDDHKGNLLTDSGRRSMAELNTRILQFIFDRVKDEDPLNLNEIYSHAKKYRQPQSTDEEKKDAREKLEQAIKDSCLTDKLKTARDYSNEALFAEDTFLHLICKYYKQRQRARDGRIYIHPEYRSVKGRGYENTGRFDDKDHLLTYCNHKPRQKRYQILGDLAGILLTTEEILKSKIGITNEIKKSNDATKFFETVEKFFNEVKDDTSSLRYFMKDCADAQKDYGNSLKDVIDYNYQKYTRLQKDKEKLIDANIQNIHGKNKISDQKKESIRKSTKRLIKLKEKSHDFAELLSNKIHRQLTDDKKKVITDKFNNPFSLAQIYNIVYKERNGNSKTCAVCSADNSFRMKTDFHKKKNNFVAKAQRLPAIPTRIIDGAVMRMARIVGGAIADDKWKKIKNELKQGNEVYVPIITESNRFEFEPSREELVKDQRSNSKPRKGKALERGVECKIFASKEERIKSAGKGICPYTGVDLGNVGEIDHIIPRASEWGTLNDETNLIWASKSGNQHKTNRELSLVDLDSEYKERLFTGKSDSDIKKWIIDKIGDGSGENFTFGKYKNFRNLTEDQQKAFRHALFLVREPLQKKVINAINNKNRSLVNGTQRYFAEVVANQIYKKTKKEKIDTKNIRFDYFGVASDGSVNSVPRIRKKLENKKDNDGNLIYPELQRHKKEEKEEGEKQTIYSHLLDAKFAFMIALSNHYCSPQTPTRLDHPGRNGGSLGIFAKQIDLYCDEYFDSNGELHNFYDAIKISVVDESKIARELSRTRPRPDNEKVSHRPLFSENSVAMHFLKLIQIDLDGQEEPVYLNGFLALGELKKCLETEDCDYANEYCKQNYAEILKDKEELEEIKKLYLDKFKIKKGTNAGSIIIKEFGKRKSCVKIYSLDKKEVYKFLVKNCNSASPLKEKDLSIIKALQKLWYFTKKENVIKKEKGKKDKFNKQKEVKFKCAGFVNPQIKNAWGKLENTLDENEDIYNQVKNYFLKEKDKKPEEKIGHQKSRKVFSLPMSTQKGFLIRKKSWMGKDVFYCRPASNDFSKTVLHKDNDGGLPDKGRDERLSMSYRKKNIFYIADNPTKMGKELKPISNDLAIDPNEYYEAKIPEKFRPCIIRIENKRTDAKRPHFKFFLNPNEKMDFACFIEFILHFPFRKLQDLNAKIKIEYFMSDEKFKNENQLKRCINEIEGMKKKPEKLLPVLKEFQKLWVSSRENNVLKYQAERKFTICPQINEASSRS